jgi:hypothetical protein
LDEVYEMPIIQAFNDMGYIKAFEEYMRIKNK